MSVKSRGNAKQGALAKAVLLFILLLGWADQRDFLAQQQEPVIRVESKTVAAGESATIDITAINIPAPGVNDVQGSLRYDPGVMRVTNVTALSGFTLFASSIDNTLGEVQFAIAIVGGEPVRQGGLVRLDVQAAGTSGQQTTLDLTLYVFRDPEGDDIFTPTELENIIEDGTFTISGGQPPPPPPPGEEGAVTVHVFPNPARTTATFQYELPNGASEATLWIFDIRGGLIFRKALETGNNRYRWNLKDSAGRDVPNGPYYFRVTAQTAQGQQRSPVGRLLILRTP